MSYLCLPSSGFSGAWGNVCNRSSLIVNGYIILPVNLQTEHNLLLLSNATDEIKHAVVPPLRMSLKEMKPELVQQVEALRVKANDIPQLLADNEDTEKAIKKAEEDVRRLVMVCHLLTITTSIPAKARFGRAYGKNSLTLVSYSLLQTVFR